MADTREDGTQYESGAQADTPLRLQELQAQAERLQEHMWVAMATWLVSDPSSADTLLLDKENLLYGPRIGCFICEEPWTRRLQQRRCPGEPKIPAAGRLPR